MPGAPADNVIFSTLHQAVFTTDPANPWIPLERLNASSSHVQGQPLNGSWSNDSLQYRPTDSGYPVGSLVAVTTTLSQLISPSTLQQRLAPHKESSIPTDVAAVTVYTMTVAPHHNFFV